MEKSHQTILKPHEISIFFLVQSHKQNHSDFNAEVQLVQEASPWPLGRWSSRCRPSPRHQRPSFVPPPARDTQTVLQLGGMGAAIRLNVGWIMYGCVQNASFDLMIYDARICIQVFLPCFAMSLLITGSWTVWTVPFRGTAPLWYRCFRLVLAELCGGVQAISSLLVCASLYAKNTLAPDSHIAVRCCE